MEKILEHVKELDQKKENISYIACFLSNYFGEKAKLMPDKTYTAAELSALLDLLHDISIRRI